ncbi:hypothetical protein ACT7DA_25685 [Bacillus pacificus]
MEEKIILPNLTGGYDLKSRSGEVVAEYQPSPVEGGGVIMDGHGETIARVQENAYDGTTFDFGGGHTVSSSQNMYGGKLFMIMLKG